MPAPHSARRALAVAGPAMGLAAGGVLLSVAVGAPGAVAQDEPGTFSRWYVHTHTRTEAQDATHVALYGEATRQGKPFALSGTTQHIHTQPNNSTPAALAQGGPFATSTLNTPNHIHNADHLHIWQEARYRGGYHEHWKNFHTNRYRDSKGNIIIRGGCWSPPGSNYCNPRSPGVWYEGGVAYNWLDHYDEWRWYGWHYHPADGSESPQDCSYRAYDPVQQVWKLMNDRSYVFTPDGQPRCGWYNVTLSANHPHTLRSTDPGAASQGEPWATNHLHTLTNDGSAAATRQGAPWASLSWTYPVHNHTVITPKAHLHPVTITPRPS